MAEQTVTYRRKSILKSHGSASHEIHPVHEEPCQLSFQANASKTFLIQKVPHGSQEVHPLLP